MKITEHSVDISSLIISSEQEAKRSIGAHVSGIINHISIALGRRDNDFSRSDLDLFAMLGRIFEVVLAQSMFRPPRYERLGEIEVDGIIGSPDAYDTEEDLVVEIKCTWKSSKHDVRSFREYWWQVMSYCYMMNTARAELVVLYVCGNYSPPVPKVKCYSVEFTQAELRDNWRMMQANKEAVQ